MDEVRVWSIPMRTRFRGIDVREGVLLRGARRLGRVVAVLGLRRRRVRAVAGRRPRGRRRRAGPPRVRTSVPVNVTVPAVGPEQAARDRPGLGRLPHRQGQGRRAGPDRGRRPGPGRGGPRRARPRRPGAGRRQRRLGRRHRGADGPAARPGRGWSTSSSPAAPSRSSRRCAAASTCRSPPTSRSAGPRTRCGWPGWRPPTSRSSRCSRSAGSRPACGSPSRSACRWSCPRRWSPRSASPPGSPWPPPCPSCPTPAGWRPCSCSARVT